MASAALHRLEVLLSSRQLDGTLAQAWRAGTPEVMPTGAASLDAALDGGWRAGELSEIVGTTSSGRTSLVWATLAAATAAGQVAALVDASDRFDPLAAAAAGIVLDRLLWVRGRAGSAPLTRPARAGPGDAWVPRAIRAFDLIVRAGGFAVVALDLADVPARQVKALPGTTWLRLAHAIEGQRSVALLVGASPVSRSARGASVFVSAATRWTGTSLQSRRLDGFDVRARVARMALTAREAPAWAAHDVAMRKQA